MYRVAIKRVSNGVECNQNIQAGISHTIDPLVQFGVAHGTAGQSPVQFQNALSKRPARSSDTPRPALARIFALQNYVYITCIVLYSCSC